jgi:hypothetical protein
LIGNLFKIFSKPHFDKFYHSTQKKNIFPPRSTLKLLNLRSLRLICCQSFKCHINQVFLFYS